MIGQRVINNMLGNKPKADTKSKNSSGRLLYAYPEGPDQLAVDVSYNGRKYGGIIPLIKE